jgi:hypothetical protein
MHEKILTEIQESLAECHFSEWIQITPRNVLGLEKRLRATALQNAGA